jgi:hypothetical protein
MVEMMTMMMVMVLMMMMMMVLTSNSTVRTWRPGISCTRLDAKARKPSLGTEKRPGEGLQQHHCHHYHHHHPLRLAPKGDTQAAFKFKHCLTAEAVDHGLVAGEGERAVHEEVEGPLRAVASRAPVVGVGRLLAQADDDLGPHPGLPHRRGLANVLDLVPHSKVPNM